MITRWGSYKACSKYDYWYYIDCLRIHYPKNSFLWVVLEVKILQKIDQCLGHFRSTALRKFTEGPPLSTFTIPDQGELRYQQWLNSLWTKGFQLLEDCNISILNLELMKQQGKVNFGLIYLEPPISMKSKF